jgi:hypothetical protein
MRIRKQICRSQTLNLENSLFLPSLHFSRCSLFTFPDDPSNIMSLGMNVARNVYNGSGIERKELREE